jgi:hypothetical protein
MLLLCELADEEGQIRIEAPFPEAEIQRLMAARFPDPLAYQLPGGPRRWIGAISNCGGRLKIRRSSRMKGSW